MSLLSRIRLATSQALKGFSGFDLEATRVALKGANAQLSSRSPFEVKVG